MTAVVIVPAVLYLVAALALGHRGGLFVAAFGFGASWLTGVFIARNEPPSVVRTVLVAVSRYTGPLAVGCLALYVALSVLQGTGPTGLAVLSFTGFVGQGVTRRIRATRPNPPERRHVHRPHATPAAIRFDLDDTS